MKWSMLWDLSVHNTSLPFDTLLAVSTSQSWKRVCVFLCQETVIESYESELFFLSFFFLLQSQFDVVHQHLNVRHKQHTNSCKQHVLNRHVLVSLCSWDSSDSFLTLGISASKGSSSLHHFPFRHLHEIHHLFRCHHQLDLQARCSAIPVCRLLTVLRKTMVSNRSHCWSLLVFTSRFRWKQNFLLSR